VRFQRRHADDEILRYALVRRSRGYQLLSRVLVVQDLSESVREVRRVAHESAMPAREYRRPCPQDLRQPESAEVRELAGCVGADGGDDPTRRPPSGRRH